MGECFFWYWLTRVVMDSVVTTIELSPPPRWLATIEPPLPPLLTSKRDTLEAGVDDSSDAQLVVGAVLSELI